MQKPRALAILCLGATATAVSAFHGGPPSPRAQAPMVGSSRGGARQGLGGWGQHSCHCCRRDNSRSVKRCSLSRRDSILRCCSTPPSADDNYGSSDYSEYGYEPEYELQGEPFSADKETLEKWRLERLLVNDRWQFGKYGAQAVGSWLGNWEEYVAQELRAGDNSDAGDSTGDNSDAGDNTGDNAGGDTGDQFGRMFGIVPGAKFVAHTDVTRRVLKLLNNTTFFEHEQKPAEGDWVAKLSCPVPVVETLFSDSFRGGNGTQVVGNTFTSAEARFPVPGSTKSDLPPGGDVWVEIGLRAKSDVRMRCIFQYRREDDEGASSVQRVFLVREGLERLPPKDKMTEPELYGPAGKGLYDAPSQSRSPLYFSIYAEGGLTIRFPLKVDAGQGGVISVDWTVGDIRYQADRVFDVLDGSCRRLEVTEIGTQDAEKFLPQEKF